MHIRLTKSAHPTYEKYGHPTYEKCPSDLRKSAHPTYKKCPSALRKMPIRPTKSAHTSYETHLTYKIEWPSDSYNYLFLPYCAVCMTKAAEYVGWAVERINITSSATLSKNQMPSRYDTSKSTQSLEN